MCECVFAKIFCRVLFCFASSPNDSKLKRARQNMRGGVKIKHSLRPTHTHAYTHANAYAATGEMRRISVYCTLLCKHIERNADDDADAGCRLELSLSLSLTLQIGTKASFCDLNASLMSRVGKQEKRREQYFREIIILTKIHYNTLCKI